MKAVKRLIKVNGIIVDSAVDFSQTVNINERWRKKTLDDVTHREVSSVKEEIVCTFEPRTATAGDVLWNLLGQPNETTIVEYPNTSSTTSVKTMMITKISRKLIKSVSGVNHYGAISVTFTER